MTKKTNSNPRNDGVRGCVYTIIRYLPNPLVGEFINVGIVVLDPRSGEWGFRQVRDYKHLFRLADEKSAGIIENFFDSLPNNAVAYAPKAGTDTERASNWLTAMEASNRSVVQLSTPMPTLSSVIEDRIDELYDLFIIEE